jgi:hypothetical protein
MNSCFKVKDRVATDYAVQGLEVGKIYEVVNIERMVTVFGDFLYYVLHEEGKDNPADIVVGNSHLILRRVD